MLALGCPWWASMAAGRGGSGHLWDPPKVPGPRPDPVPAAGCSSQKEASGKGAYGLEGAERLCRDPLPDSHVCLPSSPTPATCRELEKNVQGFLTAKKHPNLVLWGCPLAPT